MDILTIANCAAVESQGSGYVIAGFAREMTALGHRVTILDSTRVLLFAAQTGARTLRMSLGMAWAALRGLSARQVDVVEFYGGEAWLAIFLLTLWPGRRFLVVAHSNGIEPACHRALGGCPGPPVEGMPRFRWHQRVIMRWMTEGFRRVDGIVTVSFQEREYALAERLQPATRVAAIENALPDAYLGLEVNFARARRIGFCGTWLQRKGAEVIREDMARVLQEFPDSTFSLCGVGAGFRREEFFPEAVQSRIEVIPFIADKLGLRDWYLSLSILIVPSVYESFGLVAAEAMACGCAVAATKVGFASTLKDGEEVLHLQSSTSPALRTAVAALLQDDLLRERIARRGFRRAQSLRWSDAARALERTYQNWRKERSGSDAG